MNQRDKTSRLLNSDTFLGMSCQKELIADTKLEILQLVHKRKFNKISQKRMAHLTGFSLATIRRFEKLEVDSLKLYLFYKEHLSYLPTKKYRRKGYLVI